ncbi:hypothetical protein RIF29_22034 [Crotalaria pallida]|uniref:Transmembrane protein n=1 Tax=Crotalaria pallida TaxID=3830 RepID=A0AAN9F8K4_CROPI
MVISAMLKPYHHTFTFTFTTQSHFSNSHHPPLPFPKLFFLPHFLSLPHSLPSPTTHRCQTIVCAKKRGWSSNRKILQLASTIALNLKIFPEPFNSLFTEFALSDFNQLRRLILVLNPGKKNKKKINGWKNKSMWFVFASICSGAGFVSWRISEVDLFVRAVLFCVGGVSLFRFMCWGKKEGVKEWFLGFLFGAVLMMMMMMMSAKSFRLGKEDVKFWVQRLRKCSSLSQIVISKRK